MNKKRAYKIFDALNKTYPDAKIILKFKNNFELLVAVMLSAQTTDIQVNKVTDALFPKYRKRNEREEIENFANVNLKELEKDISGVGLFRNKAKNIKTTAMILHDKFGDIVPDSMEKLISLPGVGRKTANVVLGNAFGKTEGIAVDTHVARFAIKYKLTTNKNPDKIEKDLMKIFDKKDWYKLTYLFIEHGRELRKGEKDFIESLL